MCICWDGSHLRPRPHPTLSLSLLPQSPPKTTGKNPSHAFRPSASPAQHPLRRRRHHSVGCYIILSNGGHLRSMRRPPLYFLMGAISPPKTRGRRVVRTSRAPQRLRRTNGEVWRRALGPWRMLPWRARAKPLGFSRAAVAHFVVSSRHAHHRCSCVWPYLLYSHRYIPYSTH